MKRYAIAASILALSAGGAFAATLADLDTDKNGTLSMAEVQAKVSTVTEDQFKAMDTNADGAIDATEFDVAVKAGTIPAQ